MRRRGAAAAAVVAGLLAGTASAAANTATPADVAAAITAPRLERHLRALGAIAAANGGNRAAGTPGYDASRDYVAAQLRAAGYTVSVQPFTYPTFTVLGPPTLTRIAPEPADFVADTVDRSAAGDVTASLTAVDVALGADRTSTSACEPADFAAFPAGDVALVQRGACTYATKIANATAAGARAVVVFNQGDTPAREGPLNAGADAITAIPAVSVDFATGRELAAGRPTVHVVTRTEQTTTTSTNVIAQTARGDRDRVVTVGAHLDSVPAGPGINDNGSGVAFVLELARQIARLDPRHELAVRFAFWGAEEAGDLGSEAYARSLSKAQAGAIAAYLNFDMLGSPGGARYIYDGDPSGAPELAGPAGSVAIERAFARWFAAQRLTTRRTPMDGRSDYEPFRRLGIPVGGLFAGEDDAYHTAGDGTANIDPRLLVQLSQAGAFVTLRLARDEPRMPVRGR